MIMGHGLVFYVTGSGWSCIYPLVKLVRFMGGLRESEKYIWYGLVGFLIHKMSI